MKKEKSEHSKKLNILLIIFIVIFVISLICLRLYLYNNHKNKQEDKNILNNIQIESLDITEEEKTEKYYN